MNKLYIFALLSLALCFALPQAYAQAPSRKAARTAMRAKSREISKFTTKRSFGKSKQYSAVGAFLGASNYFGDLSPRTTRLSTSLNLTRTYIGGYYTKRINANFSWRASLAWARLKGDDFNADRTTIEGEYRHRRNLNFRNDLIEFSAVAIADIMPTDRGYLRRSFLNGYGLIGLSLFYHNPKGYVPKGLGLPGEGTWVALRPLGTEGQGLDGYNKQYGSIQPAVLLGGGVKYRVSDKLDIGLEFAWRFTFTDYLDDVSGNYVNDKDAFAGGKDKLWYIMSNKSGLATGGSKDETRSFPDRSEGGPTFETLTPAGTYVVGGTASDVRRIQGFGVKDAQRLNAQTGQFETFVDTGSPRGLSALDGYTVTTLTGSYILEFRARTPKFR
jgi:hypothetical protein